jgi:hypothetical protein
METTDEKKSCNPKKCRCFCHKMSGLFWIAIGVIILLRAFDVLKGNLVWIIIGALAIVGGLQRIMGGFCKCCDKAGAD